MAPWTAVWTQKWWEFVLSVLWCLIFSYSPLHTTTNMFTLLWAISKWCFTFWLIIYCRSSFLSVSLSLPLLFLSCIISQLFLSLLLSPIFSLLSLPLLRTPPLLPPLILSSLCCITFDNHEALSRFSYSESLTLGEAHISLFSACLNLYLPSGCCAALSSLPHLTLMITFTNHTWEKLWFQHSPVLLSGCDRALKPFQTVVQHLLWWSDAFRVFILNIRRKMQM